MASRVLQVLYVRRGASEPLANLEAWRERGVETERFTGTLDALTTRLDSRQFDGLAIEGLDAELAHAIERSLRTSTMPIVVLCDQLDGLRLSPDDARAWERFAVDPRVRFVFRSKWHRDQTPARATGVVILPAMPVAQPISPRGPTLRVRFARHSEDTAHCFLHTSWLLRRSEHFDALEFSSDAPPIDWPPELRLFEARGDADVVLVAGGPRSHDPLSLEWLARRAAVLTTGGGGSGESLPSSALVPAPDPGLFAERVLALLAKPGAAKPKKARSASAQAAAEVKLLAPRKPKPVARSSKKKILTVVIPAWNAQRHLERCVRSLARGGHGDLEVLIVNDGSTDATSALADSLISSTVRVLHQTNRGHGGAINAGLAEAKGTWFRVVDADDWVDGPAFAELLEALRREETADLVLTDYAEVRPEFLVPKRVPLFDRLPTGGLCTFDALTHPRFGLTSWGPLLSTSTFRTALLREAGLKLTEHSAYVDLEYCTLGLERVETLRALDLDLYRYSLGSETQSVSDDSYGKRFRQHEAVITRLCEFVESPKVSAAKRTYITERVIAPVVLAHLDVLRRVLRDGNEEKAFRERMRRFSFVEVPELSATARLKGALKAVLPPSMISGLAGARRYFE